LARAAADVWVPDDDFLDALNRLPGPRLTPVDLRYRMEAVRDLYGPEEDLREGRPQLQHSYTSTPGCLGARLFLNMMSGKEQSVDLALSHMGLIEGKVAIDRDRNSFWALLMSHTTFKDRNFSTVKDMYSIDRHNIFECCNMPILANRHRKTFHLFLIDTRNLSNPMAHHNLLRGAHDGLLSCDGLSRPTLVAFFRDRRVRSTARPHISLEASI
jgi:hypothetical protein